MYTYISHHICANFKINDGSNQRREQVEEISLEPIPQPRGDQKKLLNLLRCSYLDRDYGSEGKRLRDERKRKKVGRRINAVEGEERGRGPRKGWRVFCGVGGPRLQVGSRPSNRSKNEGARNILWERRVTSPHEPVYSALLLALWFSRPGKKEIRGWKSRLRFQSDRF